MILPACLPSDPPSQMIDRPGKSVTESKAPGSVDAPPSCGIREIVAASPAAARLLPHLMRNLANEIEGAVHGPIPPIPPNPPDTHADCRYMDTEVDYGTDAVVGTDGEAIARH